MPAKSAQKLQSDRDKAAALLKKALDLGEKDDDNWQHSSAVKLQMKRIDPKFNEKAIEFSSFMEFVESRPKLVEVKEIGLTRMLRLRCVEDRRATSTPIWRRSKRANGPRRARISNRLGHPLSPKSGLG